MSTELDTLKAIKSHIQASVERSTLVALSLIWLIGLITVSFLLLFADQSASIHHSRVITITCFGAGALICLGLLKTRGSKAAIVMFGLICFATLTSHAIRSGMGIATPSLMAAMSVLMVAGFTVSVRLGNWATICALLSVLGMMFAHTQGWIHDLTPSNMPSPVSYALSYGVMLALARLAVHQFSEIYLQAIGQLDATSQALHAKVEEQKQTAQQLKDSEKRLTDLLDHTPMAILIYEAPSARLHYANRHALEAHGAKDIDELLSFGISRDAPFARQDLVQAIRGTHESGSQEITWRSLTKWGHELCWSVKLDVLNLGGVNYVVAFAEDITNQITLHQALIDERFQLEETIKERTNELFKQQYQLRGILDALPVALSVKSLEGQYRLCNRVFEDMTGKDRTEILQHMDSEVFNAATAHALGHDDLQVLESGISKRREQDITTSTGELKDYLITKAPLLNEHGQAQALLTLATDISDIKALQRSLRATTMEAKRLAQIKTDFLANMSHEIRTPLNGVLGLAHVGTREHANTPGALALFQKITRSGQHLLGVINDILDFSKMDAGKLSIESHSLSPAQLAQTAIDLLSEQARSKGLPLILLNQGMPGWIIGDSLRIQQVLINLLSNAIKFTEQGHVAVILGEHNDQIFFKIQDSGIGMTQPMMARIFNAFEQADNSTVRQFGGAGLGLTISRQLARLMGGDITVESTPGFGSTFTLVLPSRVCPAPPEADAPRAVQTEAQPLRDLRVLAVDDVDVNREILISLLGNAGARTICAIHGLDAIEQIQTLGPNYFDVVLMDVQMPTMDGLTASRQIKAIAPNLPIIALTAHAMPQERQRCLDAGMVGHVSKPVDPDLLVDAILAHTPKRTLPAPEAALPQPKPLAARPAPAGPAELPPLEGADLPMALLRCGGKQATLIKVLTKFAQSQQNFVPQFDELLKQELDSARRAAHALKGTAANLGFADVSRLAAGLEQVCAKGETEKIAEHVQQLGEQLAVTLSRLNDWLAQQNESPSESASIAYNGG